MNNHFEELRLTIGTYRNADFYSINVLRNLSNFLNSWTNHFRGIMPHQFTIPGRWDVNLSLEDIVYRMSNSQLFENFNYPDIVRWVLVLINQIESRFVNILGDLEYLPNPPMLWRQNAGLVLDL